MTRTARPTGDYPGAPLQPTGNPMKDGLGPAAWATDRADRPDLTAHGDPRIQPISILEGWSVETRDPDPRGMTVVGADGVPAGRVTDLWVDRAEPTLRYLQVELEGDADAPVLLPMGYCRIRRREGEVRVKAIKAEHFRDVPRTKASDQITLLEEDKIVAYFAGGYLYADPSRAEPIF